MSETPLLDTHIWLWWLLRDPRLSLRQQSVLDGLPRDRRPCISDISLWETAMLVEKKRVVLHLPLEDWFRLAAGPSTVRVLPITPPIAAEIANLPASFHRDPADRIIVATARVMRLPVATMDRLVSDSRLIKIWKP